MDEVDQISFSGKRASIQGQEVTYVTERCVLKLIDGRMTVTEIAGVIWKQIFWRKRQQA